VWVSGLCREKSDNLVIILNDRVSWRGISGNCVNSTRICGKSKVEIVSGICREIKGRAVIWHKPKKYVI
jgi:hypothetical protein